MHPTASPLRVSCRKVVSFRPRSLRGLVPLPLANIGTAGDCKFGCNRWPGCSHAPGGSRVETPQAAGHGDRGERGEGCVMRISIAPSPEPVIGGETGSGLTGEEAKHGRGKRTAPPPGAVRMKSL